MGRLVLSQGLEPLEARKLLSVTTDDQGWTVFGRSADTRIVYVSSSSGNDANSGLSDIAPVKTLAKAKTLLRNGAPDWLLLKRGDVWTENFTGWNKSGRSASEMMVLGAYGTGARPTLNTGINSAFTNGSLAIANVAVVGINFHAHTRDSASPTYSGITAGSVGVNLTGNVRTILLEDDVLDDYTYNLSLTGNAGRLRDITLRRSIVTDAWSIDGKSQGLYADEVDGLVLEGNLFDHNGWNETVPGAAANIFSHGIYMSSDNTGVVVRGNVISNSSSHGVQARSGGIIENNVFLRNPINLLVGGGSPTVHPFGVEGRVVGNVFLDSRSISGSARGTGLELSNLKPGGGMVVADNIFTADAHRAASAITFGTTSDATNLSQSMGINDLTIRNNIVYDWYSGFSLPQGFKLGGTGNLGVNNVRVENNDFQNTAIARIVREGPTPNTAELYFGNNRYSNNFAPSGWFEVNGVTTSYATWVNTVEPTAQQIAPAYAEPARSIAAYNVSLGGDASFDALMSVARAQDRLTLDGRYTAPAIINYVRSGFAEGGIVPGGVATTYGAQTSDATPAGNSPTDPADTSGPAAALTAPPANLTTGGTAGQQFTVTYTDASAIDTNSIGTGDVRVTGPNGYSQNATQVSKTTTDNGKTFVVVYAAPAAGGYWDVTDAGTYMLALTSSAVKDTFNNGSTAVASFGSFTVNVPPDTAAPTLAFATPPNITSGGTAPQTFTLTFTDDTAVDVNTIGAGDVLVTVPGGSVQAATFVSKTSSNNGKTVVATYTLAAPGGNWDITDNGTYSVALASGAVADVIGQATAGGSLGSFVVNVPFVDIFAPAPSLTAPTQANAGIAPYTFDVTFTDDTGVDVATIGASDVTVTGPGGGSVAVTFVGQVSSNNGETIKATFSIAAPGGYWDAGDNGTYQVALADGVVKDVLGNIAAGASLGAFSVNVAADSAAPTAALAAATVTAVGADLHTFTVTYADMTGVDASSVGNGDVQVTGPASYSQLANFVSASPSTDGKTVTATYTITAPGGDWDFFDNGTYAVKLTGGAVQDLGGNASAAAQVGTFTVNILDTAAPIASLSVADITTAGTLPQTFTIIFDDDNGINLASVGGGDVRVVGPDGAAQIAALASKVASNGGRTVTATYTVAAPGGAWDRADNGDYHVDIASAQVLDVANNPVAVGQIGAFTVAIADTTAPTASLTSALDLTTADSADYSFTVTYADDGAIDPSSVGDGDLLVTGPGGYSQSVTLVSTQSSDASTVVATYSIPARGGSWDPADNGTYAIALLGGAVSDASANPIAAASLGSFAVNVPLPADSTAPAALLSASDITTGGGATKTFTITYTDDVAIDVSGVSASGVSVSGPGNYSQQASLVTKTSTDAQTVVVTYGIPAPGGAWDPADNGSYAVALASGSVVDAANNPVAAATLGSFDVNVPDTTAPIATLAAANITTASSAAYTFTVTYTDELAIDPASVGDGDVLVSGPGGFSQVATFVSRQSPNGKTVIGTYSITGPGSAWDFADNGAYSVAVRSNEVTDAAANPVAVGAIGGFTVGIAPPDTAPPVASLPVVSAITATTTAAKTFTVTYTDASGIDVTTIGAGDVTVTGPNAYSQSAAYVSRSSPDGGKTVNVVYSVLPPGGSWDAADDGTYTVALAAAAVKDTLGNTSVAAKLGTFAVNVPMPLTTTTLTTATSTYVRDGSSATANFATATDLQVRRANSTGNTRETYVRFDLSTISNVSSAKLRLNGKLSAAGSVAVAVYGAASTTWGETITWNTRPATNTAALATRTMTSTTYAAQDWDVSAYLQQLKASGATAVTFVLRGVSNTSANATFKSDEYATVAERPQLLVTQAVAPAGTPSIVLSKTALTAPEGGSGTFTVQLSSAPATNVTVTVSRTSGDTSLSAAPASLLFTAGNWNVAQTVTIADAQDADTLNGQAVFSVASNGLTTRTLMATEADDDAAALMAQQLTAPGNDVLLGKALEPQLTLEPIA